MSLINDMLSDLEQRRGGHTPNTDQLLEGVQVVAPVGHPTKGLALVVIATVFGGLAACFAWYALSYFEHDKQSSIASSELQHNQPVPTPERTTVAIENTTLNPAFPLEQSAPASVAEVEVSNTDRLIDEQADAEAVKPAPVESASVDSAAPDTSAAIVAEAAEELTQQHDNLAETEAPSAPHVSYKGSVHKAAVQTMATPQVMLEEILRRGDSSAQWHEELAAFAVQHHDFPNAQQAYAQALMRVGNSAEAEAVLRASLSGHPLHLANLNLLAHVMVGQGKLDDALRQLSAVPGASRDSELNAFLAAIQQRLGRHGEAIETYRQALQTGPAQGAWWIGLAISLDAENRPGQAQKAFQRALADRALSTKLRQFAEQQIGRITSNS